MTSEKRLIDASAVLRHFDGYGWEQECDAEIILDYIAENAPTVDAVEVVHGRWYKAPYHPYRCSCCGEMALLDMYGESHVRSNYCPNCGAKMDGGKDNESSID